jgi:hypothetical protein
MSPPFPLRLLAAPSLIPLWTRSLILSSARSAMRICDPIYHPVEIEGHARSHSIRRRGYPSIFTRTRYSQAPSTKRVDGSTETNATAFSRRSDPFGGRGCVRASAKNLFLAVRAPPTTSRRRQRSDR